MYYSTPYVLFLGTLPCGVEVHRNPGYEEFSYRDFREFSKTVLNVLTNVDNVEHLAMTIHGVNYGKDEIESAIAEFAGLLDAMRSGQIPSTLKKISIVDIDKGRVKRLQKASMKS